MVIVGRSKIPSQRVSELVKSVSDAMETSIFGLTIDSSGNKAVDAVCNPVKSSCG